MSDPPGLAVGRRVRVVADASALRRLVEASGALEWDAAVHAGAAGREGAVAEVDEEDATVGVRFADGSEAFFPAAALSAAGAEGGDAGSDVEAGGCGGAVRTPLVTSLRASFRSQTSHQSFRETARSIAATLVEEKEGATRYLSFVIFVVSFSGFLVGYSLKAFDHAWDLIRFGDCDCHPLSPGQKNAALYLCWGVATVTALLAGFAVKLGRKGACVVASALFITGEVMSAGSKNFGTLLFGRLWTGIAAGIFTTCAPLMLAEIAPVARRAASVLCFVVMLFLGQLTGSGVALALGSEWKGQTFRKLIGGSVPLGIIHLLLVIQLPESPVCLARNGRLDDAVRLASSLYPGSEGVLGDVAQSVALSHEQRPHYYGLVGKHRKGIVVGAALMLFSHLLSDRFFFNPTCADPGAFAGLLREDFGSSYAEEANLLAGGLSAVGALCTVAISIFFNSRRRKLMIASLGAAAALLLLLGLAARGAAWLPLRLLLGLHAAAYAAGAAAIPWVFNSEAYPLRFREVGMGAAAASFWLAQAVTAAVSCPLGAGGAALFAAAALAAAGAVAVHRMMPETRRVLVTHTEVPSVRETPVRGREGSDASLMGDAPDGVQEMTPVGAVDPAPEPLFTGLSASFSQAGGGGVGGRGSFAAASPQAADARQLQQQRKRGGFKKKLPASPPTQGQGSAGTPQAQPVHMSLDSLPANGNVYSEYQQGGLGA